MTKYNTSTEECCESESSDDTPTELKSEQSRRKKAYKWYKNHAKPTKEQMCQMLETHNDTGISRQDVALLPWNLEQTKLIKEYMKAFIDAEKAQKKNKKELEMVIPTAIPLERIRMIDVEHIWRSCWSNSDTATASILATPYRSQTQKKKDKKTKVSPAAMPDRSLTQKKEEKECENDKTDNASISSASLSDNIENSTISSTSEKDKKENTSKPTTSAKNDFMASMSDSSAAFNDDDDGGNSFMASISDLNSFHDEDDGEDTLKYLMSSLRSFFDGEDFPEDLLDDRPCDLEHQIDFNKSVKELLSSVKDLLQSKTAFTPNAGIALETEMMRLKRFSRRTTQKDKWQPTFDPLKAKQGRGTSRCDSAPVAPVTPGRGTFKPTKSAPLLTPENNPRPTVKRWDSECPTPTPVKRCDSTPGPPTKRPSMAFKAPRLSGDSAPRKPMQRTSIVSCLDDPSDDDSCQKAAVPVPRKRDAAPKDAAPRRPMRNQSVC